MNLDRFPGTDLITPAQQARIEAAWDRESQVECVRSILERAIADIEVQNKRSGIFDDLVAGLHDEIGNLPSCDDDPLEPEDE